MKTVKVEIELFELSELSEEVRETVLNDRCYFLSSSYTDDDIELYGSIKEYWNSLTKDSIIESIEMNEYLFYKDGSLANVVNYCGEHERAGETVLTFQDKEYII